MCPAHLDTTETAPLRLVVLIHGYNSNVKEANKSYSAHLAGLAMSMRDPELRRVWRFYWPGDSLVKPLSAASYPWKLKVAQESAEMLGEYLDGLARGPDGAMRRVCFVAHSLGARVALESLALLDSSIRRRFVDHVILMAAAVPVVHCRPWARYGRRNSTRFEEIFFSPHDKILAKWFPRGQKLAGDGGTAPEAVGRRGRPDYRWDARRLSSRFGHGDYWGANETIRATAGLLKAPPSRWTRRRKPPERTPGWRDV